RWQRQAIAEVAYGQDQPGAGLGRLRPLRAGRLRGYPIIERTPTATRETGHDAMGADGSGAGGGGECAGGSAAGRGDAGAVRADRGGDPAEPAGSGPVSGGKVARGDEGL